MKAADERALVEEQSRRNKSTAVRPFGQDAMHAARSPIPSISALQRLQAGAGNAAVSRLLAQRTAAMKGVALPVGDPGIQPLASDAGGAVPGAVTPREGPRLDPRFGSTDAVEKRGIGENPPPVTWESEAVRDITAAQPAHGPRFLSAGRISGLVTLPVQVLSVETVQPPPATAATSVASVRAAQGPVVPITRPAEPLIPAVFPIVLRQPAGGKKGMKQTAEEKERATLLSEFTDGAGLEKQQISDIKSAMRAFSLRQLRAMRNAGVRFWVPDSLPPFKENVKIANLSAPGEYVDTFRVIRMAKNAPTDAIRHELAHAWDHVRTGKVKPIGKLKGKAWEKALKDTPALSSETAEKRATKEMISKGRMRSVRMPISDMFARYKKWSLREQSFDNPGTQDAYSKRSPREFYAEGYSVFHGGWEDHQARLLYYATELYELLEAEANEQKLGVPDRSKLEASLKAQNLHW